jgi:cytochrome bd ubiquinol oxidase subunit II
MVELWFGILCLTLTLFAVLDGWNIGAGALHRIVATNEVERREVIAALGPTWSWNEVWLLAAGGVFILAFPGIMGVALAGFYLAIWLVLWSFILRGLSIEVGGHIDDALWRSAWDFVLPASSLLLAVLFGAALGNVIRGVPLDESGRFSMPLFTDFSPRGRVGILDWYTMSVAIFSTVLLAAHGATYLRLKTTGAVWQRSDAWAKRLWLATAVIFVVVTLQTWVVRPGLFESMIGRPIAWLAVALMAVGVWALWSGLRSAAEVRALVGSCTVIAGLLGGAAASLFPVMLHSTLAPARSITAHDGAAGHTGLTIGLFWWPIAFALAIIYFVFTLRAVGGKVGAARRV